MRTPERFPGSFSLLNRAPSTTTSGSFDSDSELTPRMRIFGEEPSTPCV
jgi:hypothetical protein